MSDIGTSTSLGGEYSLAGRTIVITGATRGLGRELARQLAAQSTRLVIAGRSTAAHPHRHLPGTLDEVADELRAAGADVLPVVADLSQADDVDRLASEALEWSGGVDVFVSNASYTPAGSFLDVSMKKWATGVNITVFSMISLVKAFLPGMLERGHGRVLAIGSRVAVHGDAPSPEWKPTPRGGGVPLVYGTTKAALERLTTGLHDEFGGEGVAFNNLRAASFSTESWQMLSGSMGYGNAIDAVHTPAEVAAAVTWILQRPSDYSGRILGFDTLQDLGVMPRRWT